ncbi:hypothetical protein [Halobacteriovorax marinus]|uniref:hypothetical protein n=1 Tax=Halobacteriovorax marinus TaxID=97084 RepID=UPI003A90CA69
MKNKLILLTSIALFLGGAFGLYWTKSGRGVQQHKVVKKFDPLLANESDVYSRVESAHGDRISSLLRESKKKKPAIATWIFENFDKEKTIVQEAMLIALGNYRTQEALDFLISKVVKQDNENLSIYALKGLSLHEDEKRVAALKKVEVSGRSDYLQINYHFTLFKTKSFFRDKKEDLNWLVDKGMKLGDSKELVAIVMGLSQFVPNFEKLHELLKHILFHSKSELLINRAVIHLSVYSSGWLKIQTKKVLSSNNRILLREFLSRSGAFCPLNIWKAFDEYANRYDKLGAVEMASRVNMVKAKELGQRVGVDSAKLEDILKEENTTLCY